MAVSDRLLYAFTALVAILLVGMLTGFWRLMLYGFLVIVVLCMAFAFTDALQRRSSVKVLLGPIVYVLVMVALYVPLDIMLTRSPAGGSGYVLGMTPTIALYLLGIMPLAPVAGALYAATFNRQNGDGNTNGNGTTEVSA